MNTKSRWLLIVLVALLQVAMLLVAEISMFGWFRGESANVMANKVYEENNAIFQSVEQQLRDLPDDESWLDSAKAIAARTSVPDQGYFSISDTRTGEVLFPLKPELNSWWVRMETPVRQLNPLFHKQKLPSGMLTSGHGSLDGEERLMVSAFRLENQPYLFGIHRKRALVMNTAENSLSFAHKVTFGIVLLLGLVTSTLIFSFLNRFKNQVLKINEDLQTRVTERAEELDKSKNAVIFGLAKLAESRDNDTGEHLDRIRKYVTILVKDLAEIYVEIDDEFIQNLAVASSLHDIGKVGIPDSILLKPGRLSAKERSIMEMHAVIGGECLEAIQARLGDNEFMKIATQVAYSHHERWDGTGYPYGLSEEEIPLVARIVSVADVYDALTSKRPYKKAMSHTESRAIIVAGSGTQFDPEVVSAFLRHEREFEMISIKQQFVNDEDATSPFQKLAEAVEAQTLEERNSIA